MDSVKKALAKLEKNMKKKNSSNREILEAAEKSNVIQLPIWPERVRGVPNSILRGSLFAAIRSDLAKRCHRKTLHDSERLKIVYTGTRLTQSDLDVWEYTLHLARTQKLGYKITFTNRSFLKGLHRSTGKHDHEWLKGVFAKLGASWTEITHNGQTYCGSLLEEAYREEESGRYVVTINPKMARLYAAGNTWIKWEERERIGKKKSLALWLHGYISSHATWFPHKVSTLHKLSGSETKEIWKFKQNLNSALKRLQKVDLIKKFKIDDTGLVHIN